MAATVSNQPRCLRGYEVSRESKRHSMRLASQDQAFSLHLGIQVVTQLGILPHGRLYEFGNRLVHRSADASAGGAPGQRMHIVTVCVRQQANCKQVTLQQVDCWYSERLRDGGGQYDNA